MEVDGRSGWTRVPEHSWVDLSPMPPLVCSSRYLIFLFFHFVAVPNYVRLLYWFVPGFGTLHLYAASYDFTVHLYRRLPVCERISFDIKSNNVICTYEGLERPS